MRNGLLNSLLLFFLLTPLAQAAEVVYVSDVLHLGVRPEPTGNQPTIAVVKSGAVLEVLGSEGNYLHIRTEAGVDGWVLKTYVNAEMPARMKLEKLEKQHAALQKKFDELQKTQQETSEKLQAVEKQRDQLSSENTTLNEELSQYRDSSDELKRKYGWILNVVLLIALFALGAYLGIRWHRSKVAEKFGGLEI